jgi:hypothetical protein
MKIADFVHLGEKNPYVIKVKVVTKQPKTEFFAVMDDGTLKIRLKAVPEKGLANKELIRFLSDELGIPKSRFDILSGATDTVKLVRITN